MHTSSTEAQGLRSLCQLVFSQVPPSTTYREADHGPRNNVTNDRNRGLCSTASVFS